MRMERFERPNWEGPEIEVTPLHWARLQPGDRLPSRRGEKWAKESDDRLFFEVVEVEIAE